MVHEKEKETRERVIAYIENHQEDFYRLAYSYTHDREMALDVVQDAIVKAISKSDTLKNPEYLKTWFFRILINEALSSLRKNKTILTDFDTQEIPVEDSHAEEAVDLFYAVQKLEPKLRTVIILRFYEDMKIEDIAKSCRTNVSTIKSRLYRALRLLKMNVSEEVM